MQAESLLKYDALGLTGTNAAGKGEVANVLQTHGYIYLSLSDILREELEKRKLATSRENLIAVGNELRARHGFAVLAQRTRNSMQPDKRYVIDSIRSPFEAIELAKIDRYCLLAVDAPVTLRYQRAKARGRLENASSLDEFIAIEKREQSKKEGEQQFDQVMQMADATIINDGDLKQLEQRVLEVLR